MRKRNTNTIPPQEHDDDDDDDSSTSERDELLSSHNDASMDIVVLHDSIKDSIKPREHCCSIKNGSLVIGRLLLELERRPVVTVCVMTLTFFVVIFSLVTGVEYVLKLTSERGAGAGTSIGINYDNLKNYKISQLCSTGDDDSCKCDDPLTPLGKTRRLWVRAYSMNKALVQSYQNKTDNEIDVVFLGDSITEEWNGRRFGIPRFKNIGDVFGELFNKSLGAKYEGIALGIAGDTAPNLLWRIQNGEMPDDLNPKLWWVLIGTNDLSFGCSAEATLVGILRIVQEIRERKPTSKIVINGILPASRRDGKLTTDTKEKWPLIVTINEILSSYCQTKENVEYFDAGDIFTKEENDGKYIIQNLMSDYLHPTALGHKLWGKAIVKWMDGHLVEDSP